MTQATLIAAKWRCSSRPAGKLSVDRSHRRSRLISRPVNEHLKYSIYDRMEWILEVYHTVDLFVDDIVVKSCSVFFRPDIRRILHAAAGDGGRPRRLQLAARLRGLPALGRRRRRRHRAGTEKRLSSPSLHIALARYLLRPSPFTDDFPIAFRIVPPLSIERKFGSQNAL